LEVFSARGFQKRHENLFPKAHVENFLQTKIEEKIHSQVFLGSVVLSHFCTAPRFELPGHFGYKPATRLKVGICRPRVSGMGFATWNSYSGDFGWAHWPVGALQLQYSSAPGNTPKLAGREMALGALQYCKVYFRMLIKVRLDRAFHSAIHTI
jgi:hypothetical protein